MTRRVGVLTGLLVLSIAAWVAAQTVVGGAKLYVAVVPGTSAQYTLRTDTSVTPNRTEIGCETDVLASATVNCLRATGGATGVDPALAAIAATGGDANINIALTPLGTGTVKLGGNVTTFVQFYGAVQFCNTDIAWSTAANLIPTRLAANDFALARTSAGAETYNLRCQIPLPWRTTASKGARLDSFSIAQQITVAALTSNTFNKLSTTTYANNVANAVADHGGTITVSMPTATQTQPYLTAATVGTPAFMTTTNAQVGIDFTVVMQNTGVYRLYGIAITWTMAAY